MSRYGPSDGDMWGCLVTAAVILLGLGVLLGWLGRLLVSHVSISIL